MRVVFISILGEPGTYDGSVYEGIPGGDDECQWFRRMFAHLDGLEILGHRVSHGDPVPCPQSAEAFILGGSYNSVHDDFTWQRDLIEWFAALRSAGRPLLAICGGHQLLCRFHGSKVVAVAKAPVAGTLPVSLTEAGERSPLLCGIENPAQFHFANFEHVEALPEGGVLLAERSDVPIAAVDHGKDWYSVQFHPEAGVDTISVGWSPSHRELVENYRESGSGKRLIENFLALARR